jgi:hypothetical protein
MTYAQRFLAKAAELNIEYFFAGLEINVDMNDHEISDAAHARGEYCGGAAATVLQILKLEDA